MHWWQRSRKMLILLLRRRQPSSSPMLVSTYTQLLGVTYQEAVNIDAGELNVIFLSYYALWNQNWIILGSVFYFTLNLNMTV